MRVRTRAQRGTKKKGGYNNCEDKHHHLCPLALKYCTTSSGSSSSSCRRPRGELTQGGILLLTFSPSSFPPVCCHCKCTEFHLDSCISSLVCLMRERRKGRKHIQIWRKKNVSFLCLLVDSYINENVD